MKAQNVICLLNTFFCHITHTSYLNSVAVPPPPCLIVFFEKVVKQRPLQFALPVPLECVVKRGIAGTGENAGEGHVL